MTDKDNKTRRSSRQPVPNPMYLQGISQLKSENTVRNKRKNKLNEQQNVSFEDQRNSQLNYDQSFNYNDSKQQYLPCRLPDGSQMKVKFIVESKKEEKKKEKEKQPVFVSSKPPVAVNNKKHTGLLDLFISAIDNVNEDDKEQNSIEENSMPKVQKIGTQKEKPAPIKQKRIHSQHQDYIKKVTIQNKTMKIKHSQLGQVEIPIEWQENQMVEQEQEEVDQIRKKLENCKALKNISILMA